ncbi:relaxation protein [Pseudoxanthomonas dokdonensis]|uniref:Relaxation protein n=1 Tax=Pseudoxanthomonas dokdonensis TaxID=344882 RepID=A0A0R0CJN5_9GAMM|nr:relaxation protein [Pseudoxanthomonas dokdonensis]KRG70157.1 hypothetical protein ABB29_08040 [Pseudoxanthomonas dokdonensis]
MQQTSLMDLVASVNQLMEAYRRQMEQGRQEQQDSLQQLKKLQQALPTVVQQASEQQLGQMTARVQQQIEHGVAQAVAQLNQQLANSGQRIEQLNRSAQATAQSLQRSTRRMWLAMMGLGLASLVVLVSGIGLSRHYAKQIQDQQLSAELLRAYNQADVNLCEGRLCANVDQDGKRYGEQRQYRPVKARKP